MTEPTASADVVVVGAGPAGSAAATHLARAGRDVILMDASAFPRDKTCGDGLTPRAVAALTTLGLGDYLSGKPHIEGLQLCGWGLHRKVTWPGADRFGGRASAVPRMELDNRIRETAVDAGARMMTGTKVISVHRNGSRVDAVHCHTRSGEISVTTKALVVADGARSPVGKMLGRTWHRDTAYGIAARAYAVSGRSDSAWMRSDLELRGTSDELLPGYGWIFPLGNGTVNIGVGTLATSKHPTHAALRPILEHYAHNIAEQWQIQAAPVRIASALLPMGGAVSGVAGRNWMLIGDAAACINPLNGEGIDYALETAVMAAELVDSADLTQAWPARLRDEYGLAFSAARRVAGVLTDPNTVSLLGRAGLHSGALMSMAVRVMGNLITPDDHDLVARAWRGAGRISTRIDSRPPFT